jgi:hypothetical protein
MLSAYIATTFPSLSPPRPEPPLTVSEWACVSWFALPVFLVIAISWAASRRRCARWCASTFNLTAGVSLALFAATSALIASGYQGALHQPVTHARFLASAQNGRLFIGMMTPSRGSSYATRIRFGFGYIRSPAATDITGRLVTSAKCGN